MPSYLIVGSGGREHAIAWKLAGEPEVRVFVAPGSDGIGQTPGVTCVDLPADALERLADFAAAQQVELTIVGPEAPLVAGIVDVFRARGLPILGPTAAAAQLEGSKAFAKEVMLAAGVPTAAYARFDDLDDAVAHAETAEHPLVVKADGLAGGKGVVISTSVAQTIATLTEFMRDRRFGDASSTVILEEFLEGPEVSLMVLTSGRAVALLPTSRDHKRLLDGDQGPNTGGMGAITPSPDVTKADAERLVDAIIRPTLAELERRGHTYRGFLYAGLMLTDDGPRVLEYNVRLGDPETQALMRALRGDLGPLATAAVSGTLRDQAVEADCACCVVLASAGYPTRPQVGDVFELPEAPPGTFFHAGTRAGEKGWETAGGRVLCVVGSADTAVAAKANAYKNADRVEWTGRQMRRDIGA